MRLQFEGRLVFVILGSMISPSPVRTTYDEQTVSIASFTSWTAILTPLVMSAKMTEYQRDLLNRKQWE